MKHQYILRIQYMNGSTDELPFDQYHAVRDKFQHGISYTGGRVKHVEVLFADGSVRAIWNTSWDDLSKSASLKYS